MSGGFISYRTYLFMRYGERPQLYLLGYDAGGTMCELISSRGVYYVTIESGPDYPVPQGLGNLSFITSAFSLVEDFVSSSSK